MKGRIRLGVIGAALAIAVAGTGASWAQDANTTIAQRQEHMKAQGKALGAIKAYVEGKGDLEAARKGGAELVSLTADLPVMFPQHTGMAEYPGKSYAKPDIWAEWDKFNQAAQTAHARVVALNAALLSGDKQAITAAFQAVGKDGCSGCHTPFRQPKT
jgi:cytochrome c556